MAGAFRGVAFLAGHPVRVTRRVRGSTNARRSGLTVTAVFARTDAAELSRRAVKTEVRQLAKQNTWKEMS